MSHLQERVTTIEILQAKSKILDRSKDYRFSALDSWFRDETIRLNRLAEIRREAWWLKFVTSSDNEGQTPLHYLASNEAPIAVEIFNIIMTVGRGNFRGARGDSRKQDCTCKIFNAGVLYNTSTGHGLGSVSNSITMQAEPKFVNVDEEIGHKDLEMSGVLNTDDSLMNSEVVIPWLLRNIKKRASDLASKEDPLVLLKEMTENISEDGTLTLIAPQFRLLLAKLGIKVTKDVIREACRMYAGDSEVINRKWRSKISKADDKTSSHGAESKSSSREEKIDNLDLGAKDSKSDATMLFGEEEDLGIDMRR